jgi:hypothetical protein
VENFLFASHVRPLCLNFSSEIGVIRPRVIKSGGSNCRCSLKVALQAPREPLTAAAHSLQSEPASQRGIAFIALQSSQPLTTKTREWQTYRLTKLLFVVLRCAGPESTLARLLSPGPFFATCSSRTQKKKGFVCGYTDTLF